MENTNTTASKRRIRGDQEEWRDLIARFEHSGQTRDQFCAEHNLGISTFSRWRQRLRQAIPTPLPDNGEALFLELEPPPSANLSQAWDVQLELGAGMILRLRRSGC